MSSTGHEYYPVSRILKTPYDTDSMPALVHVPGTSSTSTVRIETLNNSFPMRRYKYVLVCCTTSIPTSDPAPSPDRQFVDNSRSKQKSWSAQCRLYVHRVLLLVPVLYSSIRVSECTVHTSSRCTVWWYDCNCVLKYWSTRYQRLQYSTSFSTQPSRGLSR